MRNDDHDHGDDDDDHDEIVQRERMRYKTDNDFIRCYYSKCNQNCLNGFKAVQSI